jgi:hypothetical protein
MNFIQSFRIYNKFEENSTKPKLNLDLVIADGPVEGVEGCRHCCSCWSGRWWCLCPPPNTPLPTHRTPVAPCLSIRAWCERAPVTMGRWDHAVVMTPSNPHRCEHLPLSFLPQWQRSWLGASKERHPRGGECTYVFVLEGDSTPWWRVCLHLSLAEGIATLRCWKQCRPASSAASAATP